MPISPTDLSRLRSGTSSLVRLALADLRPLITPDNVERLSNVLPPLIDTYGTASATVAADWYDEVRDASPARMRFRALPAFNPDTGTDQLIGWALNTATTDDTFSTLIQEGTQRRIVNFARNTIMQSSIEDPGAQGWQRVTDGDGCAFCNLLAGRGAVYSKGSVDFASHDNCGCQAVPAFRGESRPVKPYTPSTRNISDADRARVRQWIAAADL